MSSIDANISSCRRMGRSVLLMTVAFTALVCLFLAPWFFSANCHHDAFMTFLRRTRRRPSSSSSLGLVAKHFPTLNDTIEMAQLSKTVYSLWYNTSCDERNFMPDGVQCHYYTHDRRSGTQVMVVSSAAKKYVAVAFAGTDDIATSLTDGDLLLKPFGPLDEDGNSKLLPDIPPSSYWPWPPSWPWWWWGNSTSDQSNDNDNNSTRRRLARKIRVHAGFDHEVFGSVTTKGDHPHPHGLNLYDQVTNITLDVLRQNPDYRIFTTGHSLGAANAILLSVAWALEYTPIGRQHHRNHKQLPTEQSSIMNEITSITFGCPRVGNGDWRETINDVSFLRHLGIWRFVLGWDIIPRLPAFPFEHEGHTWQLSTKKEPEEGVTGSSLLLSSDTYSSPIMVGGENQTDDNDDDTEDEARNSHVYYLHVGNQSLGLAGVPMGWSATPWIWVPGAITSHHIIRYLSFLEDVKAQQQQQHGDKTMSRLWPHFFERIDNGTTPHGYDDDSFMPFLDDDVIPPHASSSEEAKLAV